MQILEILYAATVFLSAFLLFQIQPIVAKMILPWFGGSSAVWSTYMLFFQLVLLFGYLYAHWLRGRSRLRRQAATHILLLALSLAALPIVANPAWKPSPADNPSLRILGLLAVTVGLPYFLVSTTSSLIQAWYSRTHSGAIPYRLFALSNFASMLALLSYPLLVEPLLPTRLQGMVWSVGYVCFAILCGVTAWSGADRIGAQRIEAAAADAQAPAPPAFQLRILWIALAACASILLLAVTTFLTTDVAAVPFLWIVPLVLYLLSFILCFEGRGLYRRALYIPLAVLALLTMASALAPPPFTWEVRMIPTIGIFAAALFACCMVCHGELAARKPHPRYLTGFYVMISLGGAAGGLFVGLVAPNFFDAYYEFPIGLGMCAALIAILLPLPAANRVWMRAGLAAALCAYAVFLGTGARETFQGYRVVKRNFYGQLRVDDSTATPHEYSYRRMMHGVINHGEQMLSEKYRRRPITYFCPSAGIGRLMSSRPAGVPLRVAILGLGCGTLAVYGRPGDTYRIYEINPQVIEIAYTEFSYLRDTPAKVEISLGDGRLSLEREPEQRFDVLVMDAFAGDSVPVHLVTKEAFAMYFERLKPGGIVAVNITNIYLVADHAFAQSEPWLVEAGEILKPNANFRLWTDDFSNLWSILR